MIQWLNHTNDQHTGPYLTATLTFRRSN